MTAHDRNNTKPAKPFSRPAIRFAGSRVRQLVMVGSQMATKT